MSDGWTPRDDELIDWERWVETFDWPDDGHEPDNKPAEDQHDA